MNSEELSVKLGRLEERVNFNVREVSEMKQDVREVRDKVSNIDVMHDDLRTLIKDTSRMKGGMKVLAVVASSLGGIVGFIASISTDLLQ